MRYDAVVVGAGPSGSSVARFLSEKGLKVLLIEKKRLPRFKLCGGCLSARIEDYLPDGWKRLTLNTIRGGILGFRGREFIAKDSERAVAYIVDRADFDHFLAQKAVERGAELWEGTEFKGFSSNGLIKVRTGKGDVTCDFLIGADGFYSRVGKSLGLAPQKYFRSVEFWTAGGTLAQDLGERVVIDLGLVSRGYGWIFPKGDQLAIGLATSGKEDVREALGRYALGHKFLGSVTPEGVRGWMIPYSSGKSDIRIGRGRVFLVGDSAGMVDPLIGEGIFWGIKGAKLLAESIAGVEDPLRAYRKRVMEEIAPELYTAGRIAGLAYRFQRVAFRMGAGRSLERFFDLLVGSMSYSDLYGKGIREFLRTLLHFENFLHIIIDNILRRR